MQAYYSNYYFIDFQFHAGQETKKILQTVLIFFRVLISLYILTTVLH